MKILKILGLGLAVVLALAVIAGVWAVWFAAPPIDIITAGPAVRIDTRYLGESFVASSLIEVTGGDGGPVVRATSSTSKCRSELFVFVAGANDVPALASASCAVEVPHDSATFDLKAGDTYTFRLVSNNGFGRPREARRRFTVP